MATLKVTIPEKSQNILIVVSINAPLEKVFEAHIKQELFTKWFTRENEVTVKKFVATTGGSWEVSERAKDGKIYSFCGSYHEIAQNERLIWTFEFLGMPERGHVVLERKDFVKVDEKITEIHMLSTYQTIEDRDSMVAGGMENGWREAIEALEKLLGGNDKEIS